MKIPLIKIQNIVTVLMAVLVAGLGVLRFSIPDTIVSQVERFQGSELDQVLMPIGLWFEFSVGVFLFWILWTHWPAQNWAARLKTILLTLILILTVDIGYKTWLTPKEMQYRAEYNRWPYPGLPFDLRLMTLKQFQDSRLISVIDSKSQFAQTPLANVLASTPVTGAPTTSGTESPAPTAIPETSSDEDPSMSELSYETLNCFPSEHPFAKSIVLEKEILFDGPPIMNSSEGAEVFDYTIGKVSEGPCAGGRLGRLEFVFMGKNSGGRYAYLFDGTQVSDDEADLEWSSWGEEKPHLYFVEMEKSVVILSAEAKAQFELHIFRPAKQLAKEAKLDAPVDLSLLKGPEEIHFNGYTMKKFLSLGHITDEELPRYQKFPAKEGSFLVHKEARHAVFMTTQNTAAFYNFPELRIEVPGYKFSKMEEPKTRTIEKKLPGLAQEFFSYKDSQDPELKSAFEKYKDYIELLNGRLDQGDVCESSQKCQKEDHVLAKSYKDFVADTPYLFWKDPLGRWQKYVKVYPYVPVFAEPLIYLYPASLEKIKIQIGTPIKVTKSDPWYSNEWKVEARPDGVLRDLRTQKKHRFLFWEGESLQTPPWMEAWNVPRDGVEKFFDENLQQRGLNSQEIKDFKNYWLPRLKDSPYYLIRFISDDYLQKYLPVSITPKPDVFIRVHFEFQPLLSPAHLPEPAKVKTPSRRGFTAVEWGGVIYNGIY